VGQVVSSRTFGRGDDDKGHDNKRTLELCGIATDADRGCWDHPE
jgi:hypothetical protein